jgi:pimeloyl-ACP methyl ester carboxylesterase
VTFELVESGAVLFLHGVGLDPRLFAPMIAMVSSPAMAPLRRPYATRSAPAESVRQQAAELAAALEPARDVIVVGVSGGATIAVALAMLDLRAVAGIVAHEPLIGPLAPELNASVEASAAQLATDHGPDAVPDFLTRLVGVPAWERLPAEARAFAADHADVVRSEVPAFAAFAPTAGELAAIRTRLVVSSGACSPARRHAAGARLAELAGARHVVVTGAGHLAHVEQPAAFASLVGDCRREWGGGR